MGLSRSGSGFETGEILAADYADLRGFFLGSYLKYVAIFLYEKVVFVLCFCFVGWWIGSC